MNKCSSAKKEWICLVVVCFVGVLISAFPHLVCYIQTGSPLWIADYDELGVYLPISSQSYFNHVLWLSDPAIVNVGPTSFPWLQMVPGHFLNWLAGFNPTNVLFVWRIGAGLSIAAGWFLLLRQLIVSRWIATAATIWLLCDAGILTARPVLTPVLNFISAGWNDLSPLLADKPLLHPQWRIITPGLSWFYLSLFLVAMSFVYKKTLSKNAWVFAGVAFGIQFYSYFFFWTACGFGLFLSLIFDRSHRLESFKIGLLGLVIGLPALIKDALIKMQFSDDWLLRADRFLPIDRFSELLFPKTGFLLAFITFFIVQYRHKDLKWMWYQVVAGILLLNHQIITGLQIENFHWTYAWAPILTILLVTICVREVQGKQWFRSRLFHVVLFFFLILHASSAFWLRYRETTKSHHTLELKKYFDLYASQRSASGKVQFDPESSLAGENWYMNYAISFENVRPLVTYTTIFSPSVDNKELYERTSLNSILSGKTYEDFYLEQSQLLETTPWGPWQRSLAERKKTLSERLNIFKVVESDPQKYVKKFNVKKLALLVGQEPPKRLKLVLVQQGPIWNIWSVEI